MASGDVTIAMGTFSPKQRKILDVLNRSGYVPCGIGELIDDDFCDLLTRGYVNAYSGQGASMRCHLTDDGRAIAGALKAS